MTKTAPLFLFVLVASMAVIGCEPDVSLGERLRSAPTLDDSASCDALGADLRTALAEEFDVRLLMAARSQQVGGYDDRSYLFAIDDEMPYSEDAFGMDPPRFLDGPGLTMRFERATDLGEGIYVGIVANRLSVFGIIDGRPEVFASFPVDGTAIAYARSGLDFVLLSSVDPFSIGENHPLRPFRRDAPAAVPTDDKGAAFIVPWSRATRLSLAGTTFTPSESLFIEGDTLGLTHAGDRVVVASRFYAASSELRVWPTVDTPTLFDFFSVGRAMADSRAHNTEIIDRLDLDDMTPRLVRLLGDTAERLDFPCTRTLAALDMPGRAIVTFSTFDLAAPSALSAPPSIDALRTSHATLTADDDGLYVVENAAPLWWYWEADGIPFQSNVHHFALERSGLAPTASSRISGLIGAGRSTVITDEGALAVTTRDAIYLTTLDGVAAMSMLHLVDESGAIRSVNAGFPADIPPLGLHALFDDLLFETALAGDDALLFDSETLAGGAPVRIPGLIQIVVALDEETAYAVETSLDQNGIPNGFTRIFEVASSSPWRPAVRLTIGTAIPSRIVDDPEIGSTPIAVPAPTNVARALFYVDDEIMLLPRSDVFGGTSLAVIALRRDEGLSLVSTISDTFAGNTTPSLIDRAIVDDERLVTIGGGGIVVRAFPDLVETGRFTGSTNSTPPATVP